MKTHDNDNEPLSFITLSAATRNVVQWLEPKKQESDAGKGEPDASDSDQQKRDEHRAYVDKRLSELAAFERRAGRLGKN